MNKSKTEILRIAGGFDGNVRNCVFIDENKEFKKIIPGIPEIDENLLLKSAEIGDLVIVETGSDGRIIAIKNLVKREFVEKFLEHQKEKMKKFRNLVNHTKGFIAATLITSVGYLVSRVSENEPIFGNQIADVVILLLLTAGAQASMSKLFGKGYETIFDKIFTNPAKWICNKIKSGKPK